MTVIDPSGNVTGVEPTTGQRVDGIPNSVHFIDALDGDETGNPSTETNQLVHALTPESGQWTIQVASASSKSFQLYLRGTKPDGTRQDPIILDGVVNADGPARFEVSFSPAVGIALNGPPTIDPVASQAIDEGRPFILLVTADDPNVGDVLTFSLDAGPSGASIEPDTGLFTWAPEDGPATAEVTVCVTDNGTPPLSDTTTFTITVNNGDPAVSAGADATIPRGGTFSGGGAFTDPGADTWMGTVDYGDGSGDQDLALNPDKTFNLSHVYNASGTYTVTATVTDDDGGVGVDTLVVRVLSEQEQIELLIGDINALVAGGVLNDGQGRALVAKLEAAATKFDQGIVVAALNNLQAFVNQVNAFVRARIFSDEQAEALIEKVDDIRLGMEGDDLASLSPSLLNLLAVNLLRA